MIEYANLFYFKYINSIGGIESWFYYISKLFKDYDITVVYETGNASQLKRLSDNIRVIKWNGKSKFKCKNLFVNFNHEIIDYVDFENVLFFIHGDYAAMIEKGQLNKKILLEWAKDTRITKTFAVSKVAAESYYKVTGIMPEVCYNPIILDPPKKIIRICSAQRMTSEKGGWRIERLINSLDKFCYNNDDYTFQYDIFTIDHGLNISTNVHYYPPTLDVNRLVGNYDYFVALSDNEGYCYSVVEALMRGVPCIITPCPVFDELGLNSTNSIKINFDCSNVDEVVEKMFTNKMKKVKFSPPATNMDNIIIKNPTTYTAKVKIKHKYNTVKVKPLRNFYDVQAKQERKTTDNPFDVEISRAKYLENRKLVKILDE